MTALTLEAVRSDFDEWRNTRTKIGKIPEPLWNKALQLLEYYPISIVTKALHLSGGQVANRRKQHQHKQSISSNHLSATKFVEIDPTTFEMPYTKCNNQTGNLPGRLEMRRADGTVLSVEQLPTTAIMQILSDFMRGVQ
jgi:hypothetical protein